MKKEDVIDLIRILLLIVADIAISWLGCMGIIKLITMCFGWEFRFATATGVWLVWIIVAYAFGNKGSR